MTIDEPWEPFDRWPHFSEGQPLRLPDGDFWHFCVPEVYNDHGVVRWEFGRTLPRDLRDTLARKFDVTFLKYLRAQNDTERAQAMLESSWIMFYRNYTLMPDRYEQLLTKGQELTGDGLPILVEELRILVMMAYCRAVAYRDSLEMEIA